MKVKRDAEVRTDSVAMIKFTGLMGQNFVRIDFGTPGSPKASDGTLYPNRRTTRPQRHDAEDRQRRHRRRKPHQELHRREDRQSAGAVHGFHEGQPGAAHRHDRQDLQSISSQIAEGKGTVGKLIYDDALYNSALASVTNLQEAAGDIKVTLADARKVVDQVNTIVAQVNAGQGTVGKLSRTKRFIAKPPRP